MPGGLAREAVVGISIMSLCTFGTWHLHNFLSGLGKAKEPAPGWDGKCGDCFCVPGADGSGECPSFQPEVNFSQETIAAFKAKKLLNRFEDLSCNPYADSGCQTSPPQQFNGSKAVCAFKYVDEKLIEYTMVTYETAEKAQQDGAIVTHTGSCGLCSSAQDLAIYLEIPDMTSAGKKCATKALISSSWGKSCYQDLGYTSECASIWNYDGEYDAKHCFAICIKNIILNQPNNGPPPTCTLNPCLECDEQQAGPVFKQVAGRTRRRSGLTSHITRGCDDFAYLKPSDSLGQMKPSSVGPKSLLHAVV